MLTHSSESKKERLAKILARRGVASRRQAEELIFKGDVMVDGEVVRTASTCVSPHAKIMVQGRIVKEATTTRVWRYYKPQGLLTTHMDLAGRRTVFEDIASRYPKVPRLISVGRLDLNSEGLLLLTNDGEWARVAELPRNEWKRSYRVRVYGRLDPLMVAQAKEGLLIEGVHYAPMTIELPDYASEGKNKWVHITLFEGKNRTIRRVMEYFGLSVSRLIRYGYGPYTLEGLLPHDMEEQPLLMPASSKV